MQSPGVKPVETCLNGKTLKDLEANLKKRNITYSCEDNPKTVLFYMCYLDPFSKECQSVKISLNKSENFASNKILVLLTIFISFINFKLFY